MPPFSGEMTKTQKTTLYMHIKLTRIESTRGHTLLIKYRENAQNLAEI